MTNEEILALMECVTVDSGMYTKCPSYIDGARHASGYYKHCYVFTDEDFVIKFARRMNERELGGQKICEVELANYLKAIELKVDIVLLKIEYIGENSHGVKFYKQEKAEFILENMTRSQMRGYNKITKTVKPNIINKTTRITEISNIWMGTVISLYGKNFAKRFAEWLKVQNVRDLHSANLGFKNHKPVIFDYGGLMN